MQPPNSPVGARLLPGEWLHGVLEAPWEGRTTLRCPRVWLSQPNWDPLFPLEVFFSLGHICAPGLCSILLHVRAHRSPLLHASGVPSSLLPASSRHAPRGEAPGPSPRCFQADRGPPEAALPQKWLYPRLPGRHASVCPSPRAAAFRVAAVFMGNQREEQAVSRLHRLARCRLPRSRTRHPNVSPGTPLWDPGVQDGATLTFTMQDPHCTQQLRSAWGCLSPLPLGRAVGRMLGSSPHHFLWPRRW